MLAPPSEAGAVKEIVACPSPAVALRDVGASGAVAAAAGVTETDDDATDEPALFIAFKIIV